jgi:CubicO group peptidase (beta-lactamase class C family)
MKRWLFIGGFVLALAAIAALVFGSDPLFYKRYLLAATHSTTTLPKSFYEPGVTITGVTDSSDFPRVEPDLQNLDKAALAEAAKYAADHNTTALIATRRSHTVFEQYWDGQRSSAMVDLGEINATITALMLGIAMADRKIGLLTEPAANYLDEFRDTNDARNAITLDDLLHSSSGLAPAAGGWAPWSEAAQERFGTRAQASCLARKPVARPGEKWLPQSCDVQLLALVIERATHQPYARYISESLWKPIGAADARLALEAESGAPRADCCLRARRSDWMRIAELLVSDGHFQGEQVLPPGWVKTLLAPSKANRNFGAQVWRGEFFAPGEGASERYAADDTFILKGPGKSRLWFVPSLGLAILRTGTNSESDSEWDDARIPNLIVRGARDFTPKSGAQDLKSLVPNH